MRPPRGQDWTCLPAYMQQSCLMQDRSCTGSLTNTAKTSGSSMIACQQHMASQAQPAPRITWVACVFGCGGLLYGLVCRCCTLLFGMLVDPVGVLCCSLTPDVTPVKGTAARCTAAGLCGWACMFPKPATCGEARKCCNAVVAVALSSQSKSANAGWEGVIVTITFACMLQALSRCAVSKCSV